MIDEYPILSIAASQAALGQSKFFGLKELKVTRKVIDLHSISL